MDLKTSFLVHFIPSETILTFTEKTSDKHGEHQF